MEIKNFVDFVTDFEWVMKILDSSETNDQVKISHNCFSLWEKKHLTSCDSFDDMQTMNDLRKKFWAKYKNKSIESHSSYIF